MVTDKVAQSNRIIKKTQEKHYMNTRKNRKTVAKSKTVAKKKQKFSKNGKLLGRPPGATSTRAVTVGDLKTWLLSQPDTNILPLGMKFMRMAGTSLPSTPFVSNTKNLTEIAKAYATPVTAGAPVETTVVAPVTPVTETAPTTEPVTPVETTVETPVSAPVSELAAV